MKAVIIVAVTTASIIGYSLYAGNQKKHTGELKGRFGPRSTTTIAASDGRKQAEQDLAAREKRVDKLGIRPLGETQRQDYIERGVSSRRASSMTRPQACEMRTSSSATP